MSWQVKLLGSLQIEQDEKPSDLLKSERGCALLAYLLATRRESKREMVAEMLWQAKSTAHALANLRMLLTRVRRQVDFLETSRTTVGVASNAAVYVDLYQLEDCLQSDHNGILEQGLTLYSGPLLANFYIDDAPDFMAWLEVARNDLSRRVSSAYSHLCTRLAASQEWERAILLAQAWLAMDPLNENAIHQLMIGLRGAGELKEALIQYESFYLQLDNELEVPPKAELVSLKNEIRTELTVQHRHLSTITPITNTQFNEISIDNPSVVEAPPHNLSSRLLPFFGREDELDSTVHLLDDPNCRLVTIVGIGGIGKSSLAKTVGQQSLGRFPDGVWFIELSSIRSDHPSVGDVIVDRIGATIGLRFRGSRSLWDQLFQYLARKQLLLILDNFEHLNEEVEFIIDLLNQTHALKIIVTSRAPLNLRAEYLVRLNGLLVPDGDEPNAAEFPSVQLFTSQVKRLHPELIIDKNGLEHILSVCNLVDAVPLAIEIAASMSNQLTLDSIRDTVVDSVKTLMSPMRDIPHRHRTIHAVFEHSWHLLSQSEQVALSSISLFQGTFDSNAARAIAKIEEATITQLYQKSLLQKSADDNYRLHPLVREYAADKLDDRITTKEKVSSDYAEYYLMFVERQTEKLYGRNVVETVARIEESISDIRAAWQWASENQRWHLVSTAADGLSRFYHHKCMRQEALEVFGQAAAQVKGKFDQIDALNSKVQPQIIDAYAAILAEWSYYLRDSGEPEKGISVANEILALPKTSASSRFKMLAHTRKGESLTRIGSYESALQQFHLASKIAGCCNNVREQAHITRQIAIIKLESGDFGPAKKHLQKSVELYQQCEDVKGEGNALNILGVVALRNHDYDAAQRFFDDALPLFRSVDALDDEAMLLMNQGAVANHLGQLGSAKVLFSQALNHFTKLHHLHGVMMTYACLGNLAMKTGQLSSAEDHFYAALSLADQLNEQRELMITQRDLGQLYSLRGKHEQALDLLLDSLRMAQELDVPRNVAIVNLRIAQVLNATERFAEAARRLDDAYEEFLRLDEPKWLLDCRIALAQTWYYLGELPRAHEYIQQPLEDALSTTTKESTVPLEVFVIGFHILSALQRTNAGDVLEIGYQFLQAQAAKIDEPEVRQSFLANVAVNIEIEMLRSSTINHQFHDPPSVRTH